MLEKNNDSHQHRFQLELKFSAENLKIAAVTTSTLRFPASVGIPTCKKKKKSIKNLLHYDWLAGLQYRKPRPPLLIILYSISPRLRTC